MATPCYLLDGSIQIENREAMQEVARMTEQSGSDESSLSFQTQQQLQQLKEKHAIIRNTFQALIVASGLDWAQDEQLQETLLSLGEPLHKQLNGLSGL